ncbi:FAD:protein FMN transferase [Brevifollis gellanilyticus]|nr:FAD:protein FMN transferase [Brevifollis gellanilyticus]
MSWTRMAMAALVLACLSGCHLDEAPKLLSGPTMGTTWSLRAEGADDSIRQLIQSHLDQREAVLSHWRRDSALSAFNASASTDWQAVPVELVQTVELARRIAKDTEGVLDITLAPVIEAFGFAPKLQGESLETPVTGWEHLKSRLDPPALKKDVPQLRINVASVTEGFVMDELVRLLKQRGLSDFLLEVGGEVVAIGHAADGKPWQVGVQTPKAAQGDAMQTLPLMNQCMATSGTYRHNKDHGKKSHLIDPRTLKPVEHDLVSVTVLHDSCALADGYATALMVLGPERGPEIAKRLNLRVLWISAGGR